MKDKIIQDEIRELIITSLDDEDIKRLELLKYINEELSENKKIKKHDINVVCLSIGTNDFGDVCQVVAK